MRRVPSIATRHWVLIAVLLGTISARGHDVLTAPNGETAVDVVATSDVDLVLLDLGLPGMDGVEVILWDGSGLVAMDQASAGTIDVRLVGRAPINRPGVFDPPGGFRADAP